MFFTLTNKVALYMRGVTDYLHAPVTAQTYFFQGESAESTAIGDEHDR